MAGFGRGLTGLRGLTVLFGYNGWTWREETPCQAGRAGPPGDLFASSLPAEGSSKFAIIVSSASMRANHAVRARGEERQVPSDLPNNAD